MAESASGMVLRMQLFHALPSNVGVYLSRRKITVPEKHLHHAQVSAVVQQMGRKCVTKCMRGKFPADLGLLCVPFYNVPERLSGHTITAACRKQIIRLAFQENFRSGSRDELTQPTLSFLTKWNKSFAICFANHARHTLVQIYLALLQID